MRSDDTIALAPMTRDHLSDDQLMEIYVLAGESRHLAVCTVCRSRYENLVRSVAQLREDAVREADAVFTAERLTEQRDRILRRIERHGHPAEVVRFPIRPAALHPARAVLGPAKRWVAAAAAAGLVAGLFLGHFVQAPTRAGVGAQNQHASRTLPAAVPAAAWQGLGTSFTDDQLLVEIEDALMTRRVVELGVLDAMTTPAELQEVSFDGR